MNSLKNPIGLPSAYLVTSVGITCNQRSDAVGIGRNPHASVTDSFCQIALANHRPTAIRRTASHRSGERIVGAVAVETSISLSYFPTQKLANTRSSTSSGVMAP